MAKTVIGLFDDFTQARSVVQDLVDSGFRREDISLIANDADKTHSRHLETRGTHHGASRHDDTGSDAAKGAGIGAGIGGVAGLLVGLGALAIPGVGPIIAAGPLATALAGAGIGAVAGGLIGALTNMGVPEEEAHYYAEGVRRGGTLVAVKTDDAMADRASDIMSRHNPTDVERRASRWRNNDWDRFDESAQPFTSDQFTRERERIHEEEHIPVVEENLAVGKREVQRGGARVHTWVEEVPVHEQVRLRDEDVHVERRPADRPLTEADADRAFQERTFEMTERDEEAVVQKSARVKEEVVVSKDVHERTESIDDTVRRTHVDVEDTDSARTATTGRGNMGTASNQTFDTFDDDFRHHHQTTFGNRGRSYEQYQPAYRFGHELGSDDRYRTGEWSRHEHDARKQWEERYRDQGNWEDFKDAVRHGWEKTRR